uniref:Uncharacterized protein n=1 Tax=Callithrix jacchus TaxID=9483 RepID=A0A5F4VV94_CALJA
MGHFITWPLASLRRQDGGGLLEFAGDPLQTLFAWVSPAEAAEQQKLPEASSQKGTHQMPAGALLYEMSVDLCWEMSASQALEETVCPLAELELCAGRFTALFRASRQEHLSLLKVAPQLPLPPGALFQGDASFIYKPLTGAAAFLSEMPFPEI